MHFIVALLTMHLIALNEIVIILKILGRICDVPVNIMVQIPAEILI